MELGAGVVPSRSSLLFLAADQVAPPWFATYGLQRYPVPCKDAHVQRLPLTSLLLVAALWSLRDQRLVDLRVVEARLWPTSRSTATKAQVIVTRLGSGTRAGLEGGLLATVGQRCSAYEAGSRLLGIHQLLASVARPRRIFQPGLGLRGPSFVFDQVTEELAAFGLYQVQPAPRLFPGWRRPRREPVCERIAGVRPACEDAAAKWQAFRETDSQLYEQLYLECADVIAQTPGSWQPGDAGGG